MIMKKIDLILVDESALKQREALLDRLVRLRRHHPNAKILGLSEIAGKSIRPNKDMNRLRRELSDLP